MDEENPPTVPGEPPEASLTGRTAKSFAWAGSTYILAKLIVFASTLVLARLLTPEDFGVVAAGMTFILYLQAVQDLGIGATVIYEQEEGVTERVETAFTLNMAMVFVLAAIGVVLSPYIASFFHVPGATNIFRVLSVTLLVTGAGQVSDAVLQRDLDFKRRMFVELGRGFVRATVSIVLAFKGFDAWALVWGFVAGEVVATSVSWFLVSFVPRVRFSWKTSKSILSFGLIVTVNNVVNEFGLNSDYVVVGRLLGPTALGFYTIAYRLSEVLLDSAYWIFSSVIFPAYSKARDSATSDVGRAALRSLSMITLYGFTVGAGLALTARDVTLLFYGPKWAPAIGVMTLIALTMGLRSVSQGFDDLFPAIGRPSLALAINAPAAVIQVVGFIFAANYWGLMGVAGVHLVMQIAFGWVTVVIGVRSVDTLGYRGVLRALRPAVVASLGLVAFAIWPRVLLPPGWPSLTLTVFAGAVGAFVGLLIGGRDMLEELLYLGRILAKRR